MEETTSPTDSEENVIYQEEIVYVDENGNEITPPDDATIISEEIIVEDVKDEQEKVSEPKEFQSAEEIIVGQRRQGERRTAEARYARDRE